MIIKNFSLMFFVFFFLFFQPTLYAEKYDNIKSLDTEFSSKDEEIDYWNNEADLLVAKIDSLLAKYAALKKEEDKEVREYKSEISQALESERQRKVIVEKECSDSAVNCDLVKIHESNIQLLKERLNLLNDLDE